MAEGQMKGLEPQVSLERKGPSQAGPVTQLIIFKVIPF